MNGRLILIFLAPLCMAASCDPTRPSKATNCHLDPVCETPCAPLTGWDGDRDGDRLTALFNAHDAQHAECDKHRAACVVCIDAAKKAGAIQ